MLREICESDAAPLYWATASPELREFAKAPPSSVEGFERFIEGAAVSARRGSAAYSRLFLPETPVPWACFN